MTALLAIALLLMQAAPPVRGSLTIQGTVIDSSRAMLPGVVVSLTADQAKLPRIAITDESGRYSFPGLPPGRYEVLGDLPGFDRAPRAIELSASVTVDLQLKVASVNTFQNGVTVDAAPLIPAPATAAAMERRSAGLRLAGELWQFSMQMAGVASATSIAGNERRSQRLKEFLALGPDAVPGLNLALQDPDTLVRRNAALVFMDLSGGLSRQGRERLDIVEALPALIAALQDSDASVRAWSAQAIGTVGPRAARAIPALIQLLSTGDEGDRNSSCIALGQIGPAAKDALPTLRNALNDASSDVRRFAQNAINSIEVK